MLVCDRNVWLRAQGVIYTAPMQFGRVLPLHGILVKLIGKSASSWSIAWGEDELPADAT